MVFLISELFECSHGFGFTKEGRKIYANIQKFVSFLLGTNIGEVFYLATAILANMPVPLEALQILFLNLMSDGCPAIALSKDESDISSMNSESLSSTTSPKSYI